MIELICKKCKNKKNRDDFYFCKTNKNKRESSCKACRVSAQIQKRNENPEKYKEYHRQHYLLNKQKYKENRKRRRKNNPGIAALETARWRANNLEKARKMDREWAKKRALEDPNFKIKTRIRNRIRDFLKRHAIEGVAVSDRLKEILGCDIPFLKKHLESKFKQGMTWENYGKWHIDHKIPMSAYDLTCFENLKIVCNYNNLQPLWAEENLKKGDRIWD